jgi:hypothetical protein
MRHVIPAALTALALYGGISAQVLQTPTAPEQTVAITGRVIDGATGKPVAGASVVTGPVNQIRRLGNVNTPGIAQYSSPFMMTTGADGAFAFSKIPAGRIRLLATMNNYAEGYYDKLGPSDEYWTSDLDVTAGEQLPTFVIKLWPAASISGVVQDDANDPLVGSTVTLLRRSPLANGSMWTRGSSARTDDRGRYRFGAVRPGDYLVVAPAPDPASAASRNETPHPTAFHPDAVDMASATRVRVTSGDARDTINIVVRPRPAAAGVTLAGQLIGAASMASISVRLIPDGTSDANALFDSKQVSSAPDGNFKFSGVAPGKYRLVAHAFPATVPGVLMTTFSGTGFGFMGYSRGAPQPLGKLTDAPTRWADVPVDLEKSVDGLQVPLREGARIRGRVELDFAGPPPSDQQLLSASIIVVPALGFPIGQMPQSRVEADRTFESVGLPAGPYVIGNFMGFGFMEEFAATGRSVTIASVRVNGADKYGAALQLGTSDLTDVVVTITDKKTELTGTVTDAQGRPASPARAHFIFPAPRTTRHIVVDLAGRFTTQINAGDYLVAAISSVPDSSDTPEFLESLVPLATRVQIGFGEKRTVDLRVRPAP